MTSITLSRVTDWDALGKLWWDLETRSDCSFFQSWTWAGCLAEERFTDPILLQARQDDRVVAMGLFNRRRTWNGREVLWLGEAGRASHDAVFIEWNGLLAEQGTSADVLGECLRAACLMPIDGEHLLFRRRVVLSGADAPTAEFGRLARIDLFVRRSIVAPFVDLAALREANRPYLAALSANTRYQLRRSDRCYEALTINRAASREEAVGLLEQLEVLHQSTWQRRGRPGAFAAPYFKRFHTALIERGFEHGAIAVLRVGSGSKTVGILYNFEWRGRVMAYQSGFDYAGAGTHQKPGLTCHHQAIEDALDRGMNCYDFLAGEDRYKRSLATSKVVLHWVELGPAGPRSRLMQRLTDTSESRPQCHDSPRAS
jgi:CelD/BcsL family acetyltransferase involved in cellulose biosynthesis